MVLASILRVIFDFLTDKNLVSKFPPSFQPT